MQAEVAAAAEAAAEGQGERLVTEEERRITAMTEEVQTGIGARIRARMVRPLVGSHFMGIMASRLPLVCHGDLHLAEWDPSCRTWGTSWRQGKAAWPTTV